MRLLAVGIVALILPLVAQAQTNQAAPRPLSAAEASNQFGFELYKQVAQKPGNVFFSPFSVEAALAMTSAGAREETLKQMLTTLHLAPEAHAQFKALLGQLTGTKDFELLTANRLWGQAGAPFEPTFLKLVGENYGAELAPLDFKTEPEPSRAKINEWVKTQTRDKIKDLLEPGTISKDTDLVLTNAIYFKGSWQEVFKKSLTKNDIFHSSPVQKKTIPFMHKKAKFPYTENEELQAVRLPYKGRELAMEIVLPKPGVALAVIEKKLGATEFEELWRLPFLTDVELALPKFKAESTFDLGSNLSAMGMPLAFDKSQANFRGMRALKPDENLFISKVIHKAFVDVNEEGTEAAAATAVKMDRFGGGMIQEPKVFTADRPFLYVIRHVKSGAILFMGRFAKP